MSNTQTPVNAHPPAGTTEWFALHFGPLGQTRYHVLAVLNWSGLPELDETSPLGTYATLEAAEWAHQKEDVVIARDPGDDGEYEYYLHGLWMDRGDVLDALR